MSLNDEMSSKPLASSIVIFLNEERFIEEAIESVFAQTYDNWELLLVDDGSTDGSSQIALLYAERYPERVHYLEHPGHQNFGKEASRNLGISKAKGEYLAFLDADDIWLPHALERQVTLLDSNPEAGMVYGSAQYWYSWTKNPADTQRDFRDFVEERGGAKPSSLLAPPTLLTVFLRDGSAVPCSCSVLFRCEVVRAVGGFEEEFRGQYEDQALYIKVALRAPVLVAGECWSRYRQTPAQSTSVVKRAGQQPRTRLFFLNWLEGYLPAQGVRNIELWRLLKERQLIVQARIHVQQREWKQVTQVLLVLMRCHPRAFVRAWQKWSLRLKLRR